MIEFNLIDEPWIPVRTKAEGRLVKVGIAEALLRAEAFSDLVGDVPTQVPALLRQVLLPVVADALGLPATFEDWGRRFAAHAFTSAEQKVLREYFAAHRDRFEVFDQERPFGQVAGLRTAKDETKSTALMVATAASGNNVPLFSSRTDADVYPLAVDEAVRWLLHVQCWDTAAIKSGAVGDSKVKAGKTTGNPTGPLGQLGVLVPMGVSLYDTLLLNTLIWSGPRAGKPQWRAENAASPEWDTRPAEGLLDLWTWQSRRVRLIPEETGGGVWVTRVVLSAGDRLLELPDYEPHTAWKPVTDKKAAAGARRPRRLASGRAIWRGMQALLEVEHADREHTSELLTKLSGLRGEGEIDEDYPLRLEAFGAVYGTQSAVVEDLLHDAIPLPISALDRDGDVFDLVVEATEQAEQLEKAINGLSQELRRALRADPIPWDKGNRPGSLVLHALDPLVRRMLAGVQASGGDQDVVWRGQLAWELKAWEATRRIADHVVAAAGPGTFGGRVIKVGPNKVETLFSLGTAEGRFRKRLAEALPRAAEHRLRAAAERRAVDDERGEETA
ncbi:CRISPR system Cascade subunit CasA [Saccharopolyspora gloriosae]|uniref:CRISPR system Cascade subunit CasA n=1 Tax=Saccharopolyspora gloriosae TaxID=455344 RepID=A0A840NHG0_9PSEU|nr:CRISPR system Cascade subunit CasA [Saccharopolyspora gloriosae]